MLVLSWVAIPEAHPSPRIGERNKTRTYI